MLDQATIDAVLAEIEKLRDGCKKYTIVEFSADRILEILADRIKALPKEK